MQDLEKNTPAIVKIRRVAGSEVISIPQELLDRAGFKSSDKIVLVAGQGKITLYLASSIQVE